MANLTKGILLDASTSSEWDSVTHCFIPIEDAKRYIANFQAIKRRGKLLTKMGIKIFSSFDDSAEWIILPEEPRPVVIEINLDKVQRPEQVVKHTRVEYWPASGDISIEGYGKHTDESFSANMSVNAIEEIINNL